METKLTAAAAKIALRQIFSVRNTVTAGLIASATTLGSMHGYDFYENALESRGMDTLPDHMNSVYPTTSDGSVDWEEAKELSWKVITLNLD